MILCSFFSHIICFTLEIIHVLLSQNVLKYRQGSYFVFKTVKPLNFTNKHIHFFLCINMHTLHSAHYTHIEPRALAILNLIRCMHLLLIFNYFII
jgi:hypothetical protein